jgi:hypothetical protein
VPTALLFLGRRSTPTLARMQALSVNRSSVVVAAFPLSLLFHSAAFYLLPFLVPLATGLVVGLLGAVAAVLALWRLAKSRNSSAVVVCAVVLTTWLTWLLCPTKELGVLTRFAFERHNYEKAVAQTAGGASPACAAVRECESDGHTPPYLVFPFPGFLSAWIGIVHVPEENQAPLSERLKAFGSEPGCDPKPIAPHYYVCGFY